jgi:hypothetical protein
MTTCAGSTGCYDEIEPGLALYVRDAMYANADRGQGRGQAGSG